MDGDGGNVRLGALRAKVAAVAGRNSGKIVYTLFLSAILQTIVCALLMLPVLRGNVAADGVEALFLFALTAAVRLTFQFGLQSMLLRMARGEFVTLGFLFAGFRDPLSSAPVVAPMAAALAVLLGAVRGLSARFLPPLLAALFPEPSAEAQAHLVFAEYALPVAFFALAALVLIVLPFAFVFINRIERPSRGAAWAFAESARRLVPLGALRLAALALSSSWRQLLVAFVAGALSFAAALGGSKILSMLLDFVLALNLAAALARIQLSAPVLHDAAAGGTGRLLFVEA